MTRFRLAWGQRLWVIGFYATVIPLAVWLASLIRF